MRFVTRALMAIAVLLWLISGPLSSRLAGAGADPQDDNGQGGGPCNQPGDADQVAATRAKADGQCDCAGASNHSSYVSCVAGVADTDVQDGQLQIVPTTVTVSL